MKIYDPCVRCSSIAEAAAITGRLGWDGICVLLPPEMLKNIEKPKTGIDVSIGIEIDTKKPSEIAKAVGRYRKSTDVLAFRSSTPEINRAVLETPEADMLLGAWSGGMNHVLANLSKENDVAICFELSPLMFSHGRQRTELFGRMLDAAKFLRKSKAPVAIGSGAQMPMDIRDFGELVSFGRLLGFGDKTISEAMSGKRVMDNRKRLSEKWIMPGVEVE